MPGPAVVGERQVLPVRRERLGAWPEDTADVGGVVLGGVEIDVVGHCEWQPQLHRAARHEQILDRGPEAILGQPSGELGPDLGPGCAASVEELIQAAGAKQARAIGQ